MIKRSREKTVKQLIRLCRNTNGQCLNWDDDDDHDDQRLSLKKNYHLKKVRNQSWPIFKECWED